LTTPATAPAFDDVRAAEFAELRGTIHFNAASFTPLPRRTRHAIEAELRRRAAATITEPELVRTLERARQAAAALIGADAAEIALTQNTTQGLNIGAAILLHRQREGDARRTIVVSRGEFPANVFVWLALERFGFRVRFVPMRPGGIVDEDALCDAVAAADVAALALSSVQFASGDRADLERLGGACAAQDVLFIVDAIQQLGSVPFSVGDARVDVLATGGHKWLCAPFGTGFAWIRRELVQRAEPLLPGWLSFENSSDFGRLLEYRYDLVDDARRFELATLPIADFAGFAESLALLNGIGMAAIAEHNRAVQQPIVDWAARSGVRVLGRRDDANRSGILCLRVDRPAAVADRLAADGVHCVVREGAIRFAPHLYNTVEEAGRIADVLART
jgi:cysteine desulfurase / selenocysteine lyase